MDDDSQSSSNLMGARPRCDDFGMQHVLAQLQREMFGQDVALELGRYRVERRLGSGAMGVVYAARDAQLDRVVAVKVSHDDGPSTSALDRTLAHEARTLGRIDHANVVQVFDAGLCDGRRYVAMEFVDGESLGEWLERRTRSWQEIRDVFVQAGRGLAAAHAAGVLHRDFKPSNVLLGLDGRVRVSDFGLARVVQQATHEDHAHPVSDAEATRAWVGTPRYMAPAQLLGERADERSDQYSFCVALFEALFERPPFDPNDMIRSKQSGEAASIPAPLDVPRGLVAAVRRGLHPDPKARFSSIDALLARLRRPTHARVRTAVVSALALASLAGLTTAVTRTPTPEPPTATEHAAIVDDARAEDWREKLDHAQLALDEGDWASALHDSAEVLDAAHGTSHRAISARAALIYGETGRQRGYIVSTEHHRGALEVLERGYLDAVVAADDGLQFWLAAKLARSSAIRNDLAGLDQWFETTSTVHKRIENTPPRARELALIETSVARARGDRDTALDAARRAAEIVTTPREQAKSLRQLAVVLFETQRYDEAHDTLTRALALLEGPRAPQGQPSKAHLATIANIEIVLAAVQSELIRAKGGTPEDYEPALARARRAVDLQSRVYGPNANETTDALVNLSTLLDGSKRYEESIEILLDTRARIERAQSSSDDGRWVIATVVVEQNLGRALYRVERDEEAESHLVRAVILAEGSVGPEHPQLLGPLGWLGKVQLRLGALDRARSSLERAETIARPLGGPARIPIKTMLGDLEAASGNASAAVAHYREVAAYWRNRDGEAAPAAIRIDAKIEAALASRP